MQTGPRLDRAAPLSYRPEINGLRAIAVIPVILFHAGFSFFCGGFVGVDVFFVISGYLITAIIVRGVEAGTFSYQDFYERRARRILPALFLVMFCCIPFAWLWLVPFEMESFSASVVAVCLFLSNVLFWRQTNYFDPSAAMQPLLHTWSLAVEEQFYIVFPLLILLAWKRLGHRKSILAIALVAVVSLALTSYASNAHPAANFYLLPTRAWELMAGALCSFANFSRNALRDNALSAAGIGAISTSVFAYDERIPFPSAYTLLPVLGTCAVILFAHKGTVICTLLSSAPLVTIGLISYSAYLWHQPIFVFARYRSLAEPSTGMLIAMVAGTLALAYLSWRFLEVPARRKGSGPVQTTRFMALGLSVAATALIVFGVAGTVTKGFFSRFTSDPAKAEMLKFYDISLPARPYISRQGILEKYGDKCNFFDEERNNLGLETTEARASIDRTCFTRDTSRSHSVLIWGDSHAQVLRYGLTQVLPPDWQILQVASSACAPSLAPSGKEYCDVSNRFALDTIAKVQPDTVVLAQVSDHNADKFMAMAARLQSLGVKRVVVAGPTPHWMRPLPWLVVSSIWNDETNRTRAGLVADSFATDANLRQAFESSSIISYVSVIDVLCQEKDCYYYLGADRLQGLVSWDVGHLTPIASEFLATSSLARAVVGDS